MITAHFRDFANDLLDFERPEKIFYASLGPIISFLDYVYEVCSSTKQTGRSCDA